MGIGLSGMISGLDTDSLVKAMLSGQTAKKTKIDNKIQINKWTTEAWSGLNKKIYSFYTDYASKLRMQSSYMTKKASSSNENAVAVSAATGAATGSHTIQVKKLASSQFVTGAALTGDYSKSTKLKDIDPSLVGTTITITSGEGKNAKTQELTIDEKTTISDFNSACKSAGVTASYDTTQKRFFLSSSESGTANKFTVSSSKATDAYTSVKNSFEKYLDVTTVSSDDAAIYDLAIKTIKDANADDINAVLADDFDVEADGVTDAQKAVYDAINNIAAIEAKQQGEADLEAELRTEFEDDAKAELAELGIAEDSDEYEEALKAQIDNRIASYKEDNADEYNERLAEKSAPYLDDAEAGIKAAVDGYVNYSGATTEGASLTALGLGNGIDGTAIAETSKGSMVVVAAEDSEVVLDGATMTGSGNTVIVNGLTMDLKQTTFNEATGEYDTVNVTVGKDTSSTYNMIKEALTKYNELVEEMNTLYHAKSARDYKPLTDEQKEAMTDDQIEKWEQTIKDSLLRNDSSINSILSGMRTALRSSYTTSSGTEYTLSSFGIVTGTYTEYGKLHIYGDDSDGTYGTYDDRLQKALDENPDDVMEALSGIFSNLYSTLTDKCAKTSISSALTFYNDKQYASYLDDYQDKLKDMETKIATLEDRYYKQFTAMEKALSQLQSQTNSLASMLGINNGQ